MRIRQARCGLPVTASLDRDVLTIFVDGEERPGFIAYGLTTPKGWRDVRFPSELWFGSPVPEVFDLLGEDWRVHGWEVPIVIWRSPTDFKGAVHRTPDALIRGGCRVAWIGAEVVPFCDPPGLFDPQCMSGGVLAWMMDDGRFDCPLDPEQLFAPASDDDLREVRRYAGSSGRPGTIEDADGESSRVCFIRRVGHWRGR